MHSLKAVTLASAALLSLGCNNKDTASTADSAQSIATPATPQLGVGESKLAVDGGELWYKKSGNGPGLPVILLHGGPGMNSYY